MKSLHILPRNSTFPTFLTGRPIRISATDFRVRWVASRCRVSLATAETIIANAGFSDGERRR